MQYTLLMSPRTEQDLTSIYLTHTSSGDYEQLCRLDVLGLEDQPTQVIYGKGLLINMQKLVFGAYLPDFTS